ncbi:enoyl-CoA hydratase [Marihabitans asiaticum]|uniref:Probable enoyl-CoA hydratase echA8 n=1 Tax=Marihabitans asiaticum TaxID=415218 RepID=A0A560WDU4_9MICO|nr:enoyl-CoA hydratase [Marihabitans asiaticum]TWD15841.1 enoyl-CoA hydratase [Marihabitans asiaticum]
MTDHENIVVSRDGRVATITLNRPKALNALNHALMTEFVAAAEELDADPEVGCIVVTGSQKAFAAGADIKEMLEQSYADVYVKDWFSAWDRFGALRTPTIAAVSGYALGGGCEVAMMCDIIVAAESAKFGQPEINLGVLPGMGGSQRLTRAVGKAKAMDLILTGRQIGAEEAERSGLVARVVPTEELLDQVGEIASGIAEKSLPAVYAAKEAVQVALESTLTEGIRFERRTFMAAFAFEDRTEGMQAFSEKRAPQFRHR